MAVDSAPRLVGLLASHFGRDAGHRRIERLQRLLRSVEQQTHRVPLLLSWSADDEGSADPSAERRSGRSSVAERARALICEYEQRGVIRAMPRCPGRLAQFEHYSRLCRALQRHAGNRFPPWLLFSDDDDVWHPQRAEEYLEAIRARPKMEVVASRLHASPGLSPRLPLSATMDDITRLQKDGSLHVSITPDTLDMKSVFGASTGEYFDVAVTYDVFQSFFNCHNKALLENPFADIRFRTFVHKWPSGVYRFLPRGTHAPSLPWMYFYDRKVEPYTSLPTESDHQYLSDELPDIDRIAGMRQTLDCVLFQLAPTTGPMRITSLEFAQQLVGMLVDQNRSSVAMALDRCRIHGVSVVDE